MELEVDGSIQINTALYQISEHIPVSYTVSAEGKAEVQANYRLQGNRVSFNIPD